MLRRLRQHLSRENGFTLMELIVVVAILAVLAVILTPKLLDTLNSSKTQSAMASAKQIQVALERYSLNKGSYPPATGTAADKVDSYASLRTVLGDYVNLPASDTGSDSAFTFGTYSVTASPDGYSLTLTVKGSGKTVTITPASVASN